QGEELGLKEAEIAFEDLTDPYGIRFWPAYKGRDGCRTPMVWEREAPHAGFSDALRTWLPVSDSHRVLAVDQQDHLSGSMLNHYRETLAFRASQPCLRDGPMMFLETNGDLLAFIRGEGGERLLFVFNLDREPVEWTPPSDLKIAEVVRLHGFAPVWQDGTVMLTGLDAFCARLG
ncbi:MAG: alpha-glucosidase, partial [Hoeflea sp.]|nr:alpha-glucosidase [Hoeflea sp.]